MPAEMTWCRSKLTKLNSGSKQHQVGQLDCPISERITRREQKEAVTFG
jgi:hypothetical protein